MKGAIKKNIFANIYGIGINLLSQIFLVPLFLIYWGKDLYADWITVTAFSSIFIMSDMGFNTVISNMFSMEYAGENFEKCKKLLGNAHAIVICVAGVFLMSIYGALQLFPICTILGLNKLSITSANIVFFIMAIHVFIVQFSAIINSIFRANSITAKSTFWDNTARLGEVFVLVISLILKIKIEIMVFFYLIPRIGLYFVKFSQAKKIFEFNFLKYTRLNLKLLKTIFFPSFSFLAFPIGNYIILQGFTLVVNRYFDASSLITFNTTRTMTNFVKTIMGSISTSIWPEVSNAYGRNDYNRIRFIHRKSFLISSALSIVISIIMFVFGNLIFEVWTKDIVFFNENLMLAFLIVLIINNFWYTSSIILMATNKHETLGGLYLTSTIVSLFVAIFFASKHNLTFVVYSLLITDMLLVFYTFNKALKISKDSICDFFTL